jgi:hypothetical protein
MWRVFKAANRPWPNLDSDDVLDYMIAEAVAMRGGYEEKKQREELEKKREMEAWKKDKSRLEPLR